MGRTYRVTSVPPVWEYKTQVHNREVITNEGSHVAMSSIAIPLAELGVPIPYVAGTQRVLAPQIWWYGNLRPLVDIKSESTIQKDVVKVKNFPDDFYVEERHITNETVTVTRTIIGYQLSMQFGVCLGPGVRLRAIYIDEKKIWEGDIGPERTEFSIPFNDSFLNGECVWQGGNFDQTPDPYITANTSDPTLVPGYVGMAYLIIKDVMATRINGRVSFEVTRVPNPLGLSSGNNVSGRDVNIASIIADYMSTDWGGAGAGVDALDISGTFTDSAERLASENNFGSVIVTGESESVTILRALSAQADGIIFEDPNIEKVRFKLVRFDQLNPLTGYELNNKAVSRISEWQRDSWLQTGNKVRLKFTNRSKEYQVDTRIGYNFAAINDRIKADRVIPLDFPACMTGSVAEDLLAYNLGLVGKPIVRGRVETDRRPSAALPGDTVRLLLRERGLGAVLGIVTKIQRFPLGDNRTVVSFMEVPRQDNDIVFSDDDTSIGEDFDVAIDPPDAVRMMQAPYWLARRRGYTFAASQTTTSKFVLPIVLPTRADNLQASFGAFIVNKPGYSDPVQILQSGEYPTVATLEAAISRYDAIDTGIIASLDINNVVGGEHLVSVGEAGVRAGELLLFIDDEILGFESATDNEDGTWTLTNVHRALIDTAPQAHSAGATVYVAGNTPSYLGANAITYPLGYTPQFRITSNTIYATGDPTESSHYTAHSTFDLTAARVHPPIRPHDAKIDAADRSDSLTNILDDIGTILIRGQSIDVTWRTRHKAAASILLQLDDAEDAEVDDFDVTDTKFTASRVMIRDSGGTLRDCGITDSDTTYDSLTATVNASAALGLGHLFIRTENSYGNSLYEDGLPVFILQDLWFQPEDDGTQFYTSEDGTLLYVGEGEA